ncbi:MAG: hypothetical protein WBV94_16395 [Blastocatellia bacterium]
MIKIQTHIYEIARTWSLLFVMLAPFFIPTPTIKAQARGPELVLDSTRHDFGEAFVGEELQYVFSIRNVGSAPLELADKSLTTRSSLSVLRKTVSFKPNNQLLPVVVAANRAAPS